MAMLSKEELLKKETEEKSEPYFLESFDGEVRIRPIKKLMEVEKIDQEIETLNNVCRSGHPYYGQFSNKVVTMAMWIHYSLIEPKLDVKEVLEVIKENYNEMANLFVRIVQISHKLPSDIVKMEQEFSRNSFREGKMDDLSGILTSPAE